MPQTLQNAGLVHNHLFLVEDELVEHYNRALEHVTGKRTKHSSFHVDMRGESPEIEAELGKNYLQSGPAHRYLIVVSPNQKDAGLIHPEFSFDEDVLTLLYANFLSSISVATRVDGLYGELDDGIRAYTSLEDLLLLRQIHVELHTPSGFITQARELKRLEQLLRENPDLLIANDSAVPKQMHALIQEVGDVRDYKVSKIEFAKEISSFHTRLFGGVYIFRDLETRPVGLRRPGGWLADIPIREEQPRPQASTVVIYGSQSEAPADTPAVQFIPLKNAEQVMEFLLQHRYAQFSQPLIESRLARLEDVTLLQLGHDLAEMKPEKRQQLFARYQDQMPEEWQDLMKFKRKLAEGYDFPALVRDARLRVKRMLLSPTDEKTPSEQRMAANLLTKLWLHDYEAMFLYNPRDLEHAVEAADERTQKYVVKILQEGKTELEARKRKTIHVVTRGTDRVKTLEEAAADREGEKTIEAWFAWYDEQGGVMAAAPDYYRVGKHGAEEVLTSLQKGDFQTSRMLTSTTIQYEPFSLNAAITHYGGEKILVPITTQLVVPVYGGVPLEEILGRRERTEGLKCFQALLHTTDMAEEIMQALERLSGKSRDKILVLTPNQRSRQRDQKRVVWFDLFSTAPTIFRIGADGEMAMEGRSRGLMERTMEQTYERPINRFYTTTKAEQR